jgi:hypothetical protein
MSNFRRRIAGYVLITLFLIIGQIVPEWFFKNIIYNTIFILSVWGYLTWVVFLYGKDGKKSFRYLDFYSTGIFLILYSVRNIIVSTFNDNPELVVTYSGIIDIALTIIIVISFVFFVSRVVYLCYKSVKKCKMI